MVNHEDPKLQQDGTPLTQGYIALQSESHPIQFRTAEILNLEGCTEPGALNYEAYYVKSDPASCQCE